MKTNIFFKALLIASFLFAGFSANAASQKREIPLVRFFSADTILVVTPGDYIFSVAEMEDLSSSIFWENELLRPVFIFKSESDLSKNDKRKHILFYGCLHEFQKKEFFQIPVKTSKKGFRIDDKKFEQPTDAFFYVNDKATRMYLCKNSGGVRHSFFSLGGTPYPLHVFSNQKLVLTGTPG
jgi:hypothetical protein